MTLEELRQAEQDDETRLKSAREVYLHTRDFEIIQERHIDDGLQLSPRAIKRFQFEIEKVIKAELAEAHKHGTIPRRVAIKGKITVEGI